MLVIVLASLAFAAPGDADEAPDAPAADAPASDEGGKKKKSKDPADGEDKVGLLDPRATPAQVRLVVRGVAEMRHDPFVATRFGTGGLSGGLGLVVPVLGPLAVDVELAYGRTQATGGEGAFQMMPVTALAEYRWQPAEGDGLELFGAAGPALAMWSESGQSEDFMREQAPDPNGPIATVLRGARPGLELRFGGRIDLGLVQQSMAPIPSSSVKRIELEVYGARRLMTSKTGFDLNAWRGGLGLAFSF